MLLPLLVGAAIALAPPPGLPQYAWYYFAIFATVSTGLVVEPILAAAVGSLPNDPSSRRIGGCRVPTRDTRM